MGSSTSPYAVRPANRFRSRASLGVTVAASAAAAPSLSQAAVIWSGVLNLNVSTSATQVLLDLNGNSTPDADEAYFSYEPEGKTDAFVWISSITSSKSDPGLAFGTPDMTASFGATIDSSLSFASEFDPANIPNTSVPTYMGFRYQAAGGPFYGWAEVSFAPDRSFGTLHQWAYNSTAGAPIAAGVVPEPSMMGLLGMAAVALACMRKRIRRA